MKEGLLGKQNGCLIKLHKTGVGSTFARGARLRTTVKPQLVFGGVVAADQSTEPDLAVTLGWWDQHEEIVCSPSREVRV